MRRDERSCEAYRASVGAPLAAILEEVRRIVRSAAPEIEERMAYGMLDYPGLANLAAQKGHVSLYVAPAALTRHRDSLKGVSSGKSCVRFRRLDQVDEAALRALLAEVLAVRAPAKKGEQEDEHG